MSPAPLPLESIRIVDFTAYWAGPLPTAIMADLGAEVIKVESIQRPDQFRIVAIAGDPAKVFELSPRFNATNRNKRGLTLDLARPDGVYPLGTRGKTCKTENNDQIATLNQRAARNPGAPAQGAQP